MFKSIPRKPVGTEIGLLMAATKKFVGTGRQPKFKNFIKPLEFFLLKGYNAADLSFESTDCKKLVVKDR